MSNPWIKFYPSDWRADPALRMCSLGARGLWMEMLCLMHEANGLLMVNGKQLIPRQLAALAGASLDDVTDWLVELSDAGVFSRDENGTIYSRRMKKDIAKAEEDKANGRKGGNPKLKGGVNPPDNPPVGGGDKAQKPEARSQIISLADAKDAGASNADPSVAERALFERGKEVLGKSAGGQIVKLLKSRGGNVALARAVIEAASQKHNPGEYVAAAIRQQETPSAKRPNHAGETRSVQDVARALESWAREQDEPGPVFTVVGG